MLIHDNRLVSLSVVLSSSVLLASSSIALADDATNNDTQNLDAQKLLEILRHAKPAPVLPPFRKYSPEESGSAEQRGGVGYDVLTGDESISVGEPATGVGEVPRDKPFVPDALLPDARQLEGEGTTGPAVISPAITPTPPSPLYDATNYPFNTIHKLLMRFKVGDTNYYYVCSGMATGEFHILTAGHCVYNWDPNDDGNPADAKWADEIWVWAAQGDVVDPTSDTDFPDRPYGEAKAVLMRSYTGWTNSMNYDHDWGVVTLNRRDGQHTGWMGRESSETSSLNFSGYPAEEPYVPAGTMVQYKGYDENNVRDYHSGRIELDAFIYGGHSGGPSWRYWEDSRYIQGIHSTSDRMGYAEDTRLTSGKRSDLNGWMKADESENPPTARPDLIENFFDGNNFKDLLTNSVDPGGNIQVEYNVLNSGFASSGNFTVTFYLSPDTTITTGDYAIGTTSHSLGAWTYTNPTVTLTVPTSVPDGLYYVGWRMSGGNTEYTTGNNTAVIGSELLSVGIDGWETSYPALVDNAADLEALRTLRDRLVTEDAMGGLYTRLVYTQTEDALNTLLSDASLLSMGRQIVQDNMDAVHAVLNGEPGTIHDTGRVLTFLGRYAEASPPALAAVLNVVRRDMQRRQRQGESFLGFDLN